MHQRCVLFRPLVASWPPPTSEVCTINTCEFDSARDKLIFDHAAACAAPLPRQAREPDKPRRRADLRRFVNPLSTRNTKTWSSYKRSAFRNRSDRRWPLFGTAPLTVAIDAKAHAFEIPRSSSAVHATHSFEW